MTTLNQKKNKIMTPKTALLFIKYQQNIHSMILMVVLFLMFNLIQITFRIVLIKFQIIKTQIIKAISHLVI